MDNLRYHKHETVTHVIILRHKVKIRSSLLVGELIQNRVESGVEGCI